MLEAAMGVKVLSPQKKHCASCTSIAIKIRNTIVADIAITDAIITRDVDDDDDDDGFLP